MMIVNINSIEREGKILTIDDSALNTIFLAFKTEHDAVQAQSLLNYIIENPNINIEALNPAEDVMKPVLYFYPYVDNYYDISYISLNGATSSMGFSTNDGLTFSATIDFDVQSGTFGYIDKQYLIDLLISDIGDNRDGTMSMIPANMKLAGSTQSEASLISGTGTYSITFDYSDIAQNYLDGVVVNLYVI